MPFHSKSVLCQACVRICQQFRSQSACLHSPWGWHAHCAKRSAPDAIYPTENERDRTHPFHCVCPSAHKLLPYWCLFNWRMEYVAGCGCSTGGLCRLSLNDGIFFAFDLLHRNDWVARLLVSFQLVLFPILCERSVVMSLTCLSIRPSISAVLTGTLCMGDQASFYNVATSWLMRLIAYFVYQHFDTSVHQRPQGVSTYQCLLRLQTYFVPVGLSPESK